MNFVVFNYPVTVFRCIKEGYSSVTWIDLVTIVHSYWWSWHWKNNKVSDMCAVDLHCNTHVLFDLVFVKLLFCSNITHPWKMEHSFRTGLCCSVRSSLKSTGSGFQLVYFLVFLRSSLNPVIYCWKKRHIGNAIMKHYYAWTYWGTCLDAEVEYHANLNTSHFHCCYFCPVTYSYQVMNSEEDVVVIIKLYITFSFIDGGLIKLHLF